MLGYILHQLVLCESASVVNQKIKKIHNDVVHNVISIFFIIISFVWVKSHLFTNFTPIPSTKQITIRHSLMLMNISSWFKSKWLKLLSPLSFFLSMDCKTIQWQFITVAKNFTVKLSCWFDQIVAVGILRHIIIPHSMYLDLKPLCNDEVSNK